MMLFFNSLLHITSSWGRHQMETFSALLAICAGNSPVTGEFRAQRPVTRSFDVFFDLGLNERLSKQSWGWWFETPSCPLWRHSNVTRQSVIRHMHHSEWRHKEWHGVSNRQQLDRLFNRLFRLISSKIPYPSQLDLCEGNPPVTGGFPFTKGK